MEKARSKLLKAYPPLSEILTAGEKSDKEKEREQPGFNLS
jgi:hypothetical protein